MISLKCNFATASMAMAQKGWIISVIMSDQAKVTTVIPMPMPIRKVSVDPSIEVTR